MLITLILMVALLAIAMTALAPVITQQIKRDREQEMIHRGVQYSRAIQHFFKKFNRYPVSLEELESTNNLRFLRKRYKDPVTGKDFKILHMGDVQMSFGAGLQGAVPVSNLAGGGVTTPGNQGGFGSSIGSSSGFGNSGGLGGNSTGSFSGNNSGNNSFSFGGPLGSSGPGGNQAG